MFKQLENDRVLPNHLLFLWASTIAAGIFIVAFQIVKYFDILSFHYIDWFLLISFLDIAASASIFAYFRSKENRLLQALSTFFLIPVFIIVFLIAATFMSEMFYGGSGYHGEYAFPFLQRKHF